MVWRQEHIGRVMFTTETNRCIYNVGVKSSRANASDGAKNRYPFRDGRTMFFLDQVYVNHGTSCPVGVPYGIHQRILTHGETPCNVSCHIPYYQLCPL